MRILVYSDLHTELWARDPAFDEGVRAPATQADMVVLAGDIGTGTRGLEWALEVVPTDKPLLYLAGNHEFYVHEIDALPVELEALASQARAGERAVHFLNDGGVDVHGVRFLGCTLWTSLEIFGGSLHLTAFELEQGMNDYRRIRVANQGYRRLRAADTRNLHRQSVLWLQAELERDAPEQKVVITHHLPSLCSVPERYADHRMTPAYVSDVENLMPRATIWIHGHTHDSKDYVLNGCRVFSNPRGYRMRDGGPENRDFRCGAYIDVKARS